MANPYEKFKKPEAQNPYGKYAEKPEEKSLLNEAGEATMESLPGRFGVNVVRGAMRIPGMPADLSQMGKRFVARQFNVPESAAAIPVSPMGAILQGNSGDSWQKFFEGVVGKANLPEPTNEYERATDKWGQFVGGGIPFGPAGLLPSTTSFLGSEVGRATDQAGITGGYGEFGGAILGGMAPGLVRGQVTAGEGLAPSVAALRSAKNAAYKAAEEQGVLFTPEFIKRLNDRVKEFAASRAYTPENEPGIAGGLRVLEESAAAGDAATLSHLDKLRKTFGNAGGDFTKPSQQSLSAEIKKIFDEFTDPENIQAGDILAGDIKAAAPLLKQARNLNQRMRLAEVIDEALYQAENQAPTSGVGGNLENTMRQKIKAILNNKKRRASFSETERKLMERIVRGTTTQNTLRHVGGLAPSKGFLPLVLGAHLGVNAAGAGIPAAATLPAAAAYVGVTQGAKRLAEMMTKRNIDRLNATVRLRGTPKPTAKEQANQALLELRRRARLAGQSTLPAIPGAVQQDR